MNGLFSGKMSTLLAFTLLIFSTLSPTFSIRLARSSSPTTITVPDDYPTVQAAVAAANPGDTVYVRAGTYFENVVIDKLMSLVGEKAQNTTIDGSGLADVLHIVADDINVTGFTIRNSFTSQYSGITLEYANHCNISGNNITNNWIGVNLASPCHNNTISGNNITANNYYGVLLYSSDNNSITGNNITNNSDGIYVASSSSSNSIAGNNITNNGVGVYLVSYPSNNSILGNNIAANNDYGVYIASYSNGNSIAGNNITNNGDGINLASYSNNNSITRNNITDNSLYGILAYSSSNNNSIIENNISDNKEGVGFSPSFNNTVARNNLTNKDCSILLGSSSNNRIVDNNITAIYGNGVWLNSSPDNTVVGNNITTSNGAGVKLDTSSNNTFYHNNFVGEAQQVSSNASTSVWNGGYPLGGNYWSDYTGIDENPKDGIGDTPYVIDSNNVDRYPLMKPSYLTPGDLNNDGKVSLQDLVVLAKAYGSKPGDPTWNPKADMDGNNIVDQSDLAILAIHYGQQNP
jgi:parallel beta-helix repeat protein